MGERLPDIGRSLVLSLGVMIRKADTTDASLPEGQVMRLFCGAGRMGAPFRDGDSPPAGGGMMSGCTIK